MNITKPKFDDEEIRLVRKCLESGWVTQGPVTIEFEQLFAERHKASYAFATTSGTAALHLATLALDLGPEDEVIVPAFTWVTSAHCAEYVGARPVFVDVNPTTFNLDPDAVEAAITPKTKAIVAVHLFGLAAPLEEILSLARRHRISVIEDAACAVGTSYRGHPVGALGDIGCFSFHPRKVITTGEGGIVLTNSRELANKITWLRNHGATGLPPGTDGPHAYAMSSFDELGFNLRMSDIHASIGVAQMAKLEDLLAERQMRAARYSELLEEVEDLALPRVPEGCGHTFQSYVVRLVKGGMPRRNAVMDLLSASGIQTRPGTHAVHRLGYYRQKYRIPPEQFPNASACEDTTITLPIFPDMTDSQQECVVAQLRQALVS